MWIDDDILKSCDQALTFETWIPRKLMVVIGNSNVAEEECYVDRCKKDGIELLQRCGGGGAVLLYDGCVVLSLGIWVSDYYKNAFYFRAINQAVIDLMGDRWPILRASSQDGLSDIVFDGKKFAGTSLFRSRNYLLYQASILCDLQVDSISKYLRHPSKEPGYRAARKHEDFLVGLSQLDQDAVNERVHKLFEAEFAERIKDALKTELIDPVEAQITAIKNRASAVTR